MRDTPKAVLNTCRGNPLLRPVCPRKIPAWAAGSLPGKQEYYCSTGNPNETTHQTIASFPTTRCVQAEWGYELFKPLPGRDTGTQISAWDGTGWFAEEYAPLSAPPWHVHVDLSASVGSHQGSALVPGQRPHAITDALLNPRRQRAVSLGWVSWYGRRGQLVIEPTNAEGGLWAGHVVFSYALHGVHFAITLHAWASKERVTGRGGTRVTIFDSGPALPHVIATLKAIVGSAPAA